MTSKELAVKIRTDCIELAHGKNSVHVGGSLSMTDILAVLYNDVMKFDISKPNWLKRDRLIISKGHSSSSLYAVLSEVGFITHEELMTQYQDGSRLSGHVSHKVEGIDFSTGSLGHGLPVACGMAYAAKQDNEDYHVYVIMGDGECEEGTTWESGFLAPHLNLDKLTLIIDNNQLQSGASVLNVTGLKQIDKYFELMGWNVLVIDGNDHYELKEAFQAKFENSKPKCIIANTIKGKGFSFMENNPKYHSTVINDELYEMAIKELEINHEK